MRRCKGKTSGNNIFDEGIKQDSRQCHELSKTSVSIQNIFQAYNFKGQQ